MAKQEPVTDVADPRWLRAISHPIRVRLLALLEEEAASPVVLAAKLEQPLGTIAYHVRTLYELGLLKLVGTRQRRGATEHYYRTVARPAPSPESWQGLDAISKQRVLTALINTATDHANRSAAAGGFDGVQAQLSTEALTLDREGWEELAREARGWIARAQEIERAAARRLGDGAVGDGGGDGGEPALRIGLTLMLFEALASSAERAPQASR